MTVRNLKASFVAAALAVFLLPSLASAVLVNVSEDSFDDGVVGTNTTGLGGTTYTEVNTSGTGVTMESGGMLMNTPGGDDWARNEISDNTSYPFPNPTTNMVEYCWTVGMVDITSANGDGDDLRIQLNINDVADAPGVGAERWITNAGNLSLDIFFDSENAATAGLAAHADVYEKPAGTGVGTNGNFIATLFTGLDGTGWNWETDLATFCVTMDETGYTWSSDLPASVSVSNTWAASGFQNGEFANGMYSNTGTHNVAGNRGSSKYDSAIVATMTVPEPASIAIVLVALSSLIAFRKRR